MEKPPIYPPETIRSRKNLKRGEAHPGARATEQMVKEILSETPLTKFPPLKYFMKKFNLPQSTISFIRSRDNWAWIPDPRTKCEHCHGKGFTVKESPDAVSKV